MRMELECPSVCFQKSTALTGLFCIEGSGSLSVTAGVSSVSVTTNTSGSESVATLPQVGSPILHLSLRMIRVSYVAP